MEFEMLNKFVIFVEWFLAITFTLYFIYGAIKYRHSYKGNWKSINRAYRENDTLMRN